MYRDGSNHKYSEYQYFENKENHTVLDIKETISMDDPIIVTDFGIRSEAPLNNEFMPEYGYDHSFCEIVEVGIATEEDYNTDLAGLREDYHDRYARDIDEVLEHFKRVKKNAPKNTIIDSDPEKAWYRICDAEKEVECSLERLRKAKRRLQQPELCIDNA